MFRFILKETDEYDRLVEFMEPFGLEFGNDERMGTEIIKCWKVVQEPDYLVGGVMLGLRKGEYYVNGIAVDTPMRRTGIGKIMLKKLIDEVKNRGGKRIYLVAKVPEFFASLGFERVPWEEVSEISGCPFCEQMDVSCFPVAMKMEL